MPPFQYSEYHNPYVGSIADLMLAGPQAQARAAEQSGAAWAGAAQQTGQAVGGAIQQATDPRRKLEALQLQEQQQKVADLKAIDQAFTQPGGRDAIVNALPGHLRPTVVKQFEEQDKLHAESQKLRGQADALSSEAFANSAASVAAHGNDPAAAQIMISDLKRKYADDPPTLQKIQSFEQALHDNPTTETVAKMTASLMAASPKHIELQTKVDELKRQIAADEQTARHQTAMEAIERQKAGATGAADDQRYERIQQARLLKQPVSPEDQAFVAAYEKRKTLGPEASAAAAADRQAATIAAQTAQQKRGQDFTEQQAGRKELTDNVVRPFQQAQQSAQELRDLVHAAQAGNKEAASLQALQATMSTVRANGLNRLNQAEMNLPANAGSLWDRLQNKIGKAVAGQPINADLQKDLLDYADLIEKGAYNRYRAGHQDVTTRYKLADEKLAAPPGAPAIGTAGTIAGKPAVWDYRHGQWGWWPK